MAKTVSHFVCRTCGGVQSRWMGKCPDCGAWDALERYTPAPVAREAHRSIADAWTESGARAGDAEGAGSTASAALIDGAQPIACVEPPVHRRIGTGSAELDRVLGEGFVPGSVVLLGGDPGIGKSTLLLQTAGRLARGGSTVLYVSSEESAFQTRLRAERVLVPVGAASADPAAGAALPGLDSLLVLAETDLARVAEQARRHRPGVLIIDSIQLIHRGDVSGAPGSVSQVRRCATDLVYLAKVSGMVVILVGHVTKDGQLAGPRLIEHMVDVVLSFEGERHRPHRVVRAVKNRFGSTQEVALFAMTERGLEDLDPSLTRLDPSAAPRPGTVVASVMHGTRCLLVEIQALVAGTFPGTARRRVSGLDANRLAMAIAVLEQHLGLALGDQDVFASAAGGLKVVEPAVDLAMALAIAGAARRRTLPPGTAVFGEVGLGGEIRPVHQQELRAEEAHRRGYRHVILSAEGEVRVPRGVEATRVRTLADAGALLGAPLQSTPAPTDGDTPEPRGTTRPRRRIESARRA